VPHEASDLLRLSVRCVLLLGASLASPPERLHLLKNTKLGARPAAKEYGIHHVRCFARRLYISHNTEVKVVDADSGAILGSIPDLKRVHGIALSLSGPVSLATVGADEALFST